MFEQGYQAGAGDAGKEFAHDVVTVRDCSALGAAPQVLDQVGQAVEDVALPTQVAGELPGAGPGFFLVFGEGALEGVFVGQGVELDQGDFQGEFELEDGDAAAELGDGVMVGSLSSFQGK